MLIVVVSVAALAAAGYFVRSRGRSDEPEVCRARCPRCDQKVRYAADRAIRHAMCPRCYRRWTLPPVSAPVRRSA
jgi:hypothetical protein